MKLITLITIVVTFLTGCSNGLDRKISSASKDQLSYDFRSAMTEVSPQQAEAIKASMAIVAFDLLDPSDIESPSTLERLSLAVSSSPVSAGEDNQLIIDTFKEHQTFRSLLVEAGRILKVETDHLSERKQNYEAALEDIGKLKFETKKYYWEKIGLSPRPVIEYSINNQSELSVSAIRTYFALTSGEGVIEETIIDLPIGDGGTLVPGASFKTKLPVDFNADWSKPELENRNDLSLSAAIINVEVGENKWLTSVFTVKHDKLLTQYNDLHKKIIEAL